MKISRQTLQAVKSVSLVDIISKFVNLKKSGNAFVGLCPFHDENTSSFYVNAKKGYKCFGCDAKGSNAITFIMKYEKKSFVDAVIQIANMSGITMEQDSLTAINIPILKKVKCKQELSQISYISDEIYQASLNLSENNYFVEYLVNQFGIEITTALVEKYHIGTSKLWKGATIFWQRDLESKIRTGQIMKYNPVNGKRTNKFSWVHSVEKISGFNLRQCLFGEDLLNGNNRPIALVEAPKTAVIASIYYPEYTWLATVGLMGLTSAKCMTLNIQQQPVIIFPDASKNNSAYKLWKDIASRNLKNYVLSDYIEKIASGAEKEEGYDIADYLTQINYSEYLK